MKGHARLKVMNKWFSKLISSKTQSTKTRRKDSKSPLWTQRVSWLISHQMIWSSVQRWLNWVHSKQCLTWSLWAMGKDSMWDVSLSTTLSSYPSPVTFHLSQIATLDLCSLQNSWLIQDWALSKEVEFSSHHRTASCSITTRCLSTLRTIL